MGPIPFLFALYRQQLLELFADSYSFLLCFVVLYILLSPLFISPLPDLLIIALSSLFVCLVCLCWFLLFIPPLMLDVDVTLNEMI